MDFSGHLSAFSAAHILQWAANERRTGALVVRRARCEKRIYFDGGRVVSALSDDPGESYGRYLLLYGHVGEASLVQGLQRCRQTGLRLGSVLVELEILGKGEVRDTLRRHFFDIVCDIFIWRQGVFYFEAEEPPVETIPPAPIETMQLVLEGTRWIDELARIRRIFVHDNVVLRHGPKYPEGGLSGIESRIGAAVDSRSTLGEIYASVRGTYYPFLATAFDLCMREVLDIAEVGEDLEHHTEEIRLSEVIAERTVERPFTVPLTALQGLHPLLAALPAPGELDRYPRPVVDFLAGLGGDAPLSDLLSTDREVAEQQLEALMIELRQGRLALLPAPVAALEDRADDSGAPEAVLWWRRLLPKRG
jgi:hypothetical protein